MKPAPILENEADRLAALYRYGILDTAAEAEFDEFTQLAAQVCATPIALLSLVDAGREWFKSKLGLDVPQTPRDISFGGHAIQGRDVFEVGNALEDQRFFDNPLVTQVPHIRFYAGSPLVTPAGEAVGALCVIDKVPRVLTGAQKNALATLGRQVVRQMELRLRLKREQEQSQELTRQVHFQSVLLDSTVADLNDEKNALAGSVGLSWDITERKNADLALRASEARLQLAMSAARTSLWDANPVLGRISLDARWSELVGDEPADVTLSFAQLAALVPPEEAPAVQQQMLAVMKGEQTDYLVEHRVRHRHGHWVWIESRGRVVERDASGRAVRMIGTNTDITERKGVEQMKAEFVSTVSHELRTPLTSISAVLELACGGALGPVTPKAMSMLDIAYKNSQRLTHLINDLLDMEKLGAGKMSLAQRSQELMPLVEQAIESTRAPAQADQVSLVLKARADGVLVRVDGRRLQQILSNLLSNAVKYSPQGAQVEVVVRHGKGVVRVEVLDHGPGIPEQFKGRIFQTFSQADSSDTRQKGGTGLGLAICKEFIERMNGRVGFESQEGYGACFYCELPVVTEEKVMRDVTG